MVPDLIYQVTSKSTANVCSLLCWELTVPRQSQARLRATSLREKQLLFPLCKKESRSVGLAFEPQHLLC